VADTGGATWGAVDARADGQIILINGTNALWYATLPPTATSVALPPLPDDLAALWSGATSVQALLVVDSDAADYAAFRVDADVVGASPSGATLRYAASD
jgi:hypothetical protein